MKKHTKKGILPVFCITFLLIMAMLNACKKVDNHFDEVANTPSINANYPTKYFVGDTMTIAGKLFIDLGGYITVGKVKAVIAADQKTTSPDGITIDQVRFVINKQMGIGSNIPVAVVIKGETLNLPSITIQQFAGIPQHTDTTLFVAQIAQFSPVNISTYQNSNLSLLNNSSIDANGNIWFDNSLGIFKINNNRVQNIIPAGMILNDASGPFIIKRILGSTISYDGNTLNFSAFVRDNADTTANYVARLCQMNLVTNVVTTLNRTLIKKLGTGTDGTPGAFEGPVAQLHLVAMTLHTGTNSNLYFENCYTVTPANGDNSGWYGSAGAGINPYGGYVLANICRLSPDGNIKSIFNLNDLTTQSHSLFKSPGLDVALTSDFKISPDGNTAYVYDKDVNFNFSLMQFDLQKNISLHSTGAQPAFRFLSYDSNPLSTFPSGLNNVYNPLIGLGYPYQNGDYALLPLPNGTIIDGQGSSIAALNLLDNTAYLFAGTESGLNNQPPPYQTQSTGKASTVNFNNGYGIAMVFCGVDKNGVVYFVSSATGSDLSSPPLTFYKIYSKK